MVQELSNGGKHYMALKKAVEMTTQKKVESCRLTKSWITFIFEDGSWALLRFSGTENVLRYYMEFSTEIECERNLKAITNFIAHYGK